MAPLCIGCGDPVPLKARGMQDPPTAGHCSRRCYMRHYHQRRAHERRLSQVPRIGHCSSCGASWCVVPGYRSRTFCSTACKEKARSEASRKPKQIFVCTCGTEFQSARNDARFCARRCASRWQRENAPPGCVVADCERPLRAKDMCNTHYRRARGEKQIWNDKRRDHYHRRRAQKKATADDRPVLLSEIRERDGNRCHLCCKKVSVKPYPHPLSASLDHIVPLSLDGEHVPENVRLAHLRCNVAKGNGGGNEQLLLIG